MEAQGCEGDIVVRCGLHIVDAAACGGKETEVFHNGGQRIRLVTPVGIIDGGVEVVVVTAPLGFLKAGVASQYNQVCDCTDQGSKQNLCKILCIYRKMKYVIKKHEYILLCHCHKKF